MFHVDTGNSGGNGRNVKYTSRVSDFKAAFTWFEQTSLDRRVELSSN